VAPDGTIAVTSHNGNDLTEEFAVLAGGLGDVLAGRAAVLDGELVVLNESGQPEFGLMQERRGRYHQGYSVADEPVLYVVFDLLQLGDTRLLTETYDRRRALLEQLDLPHPERITVSPAFTHSTLTQLGLTPSDLLERAAAAGYEGLVAKRRASATNLGNAAPSGATPSDPHPGSHRLRLETGQRPTREHHRRPAARRTTPPPAACFMSGTSAPVAAHMAWSEWFSAVPPVRFERTLDGF
jgi:ATP dependent DNA ligase domain